MKTLQIELGGFLVCNDDNPNIRYLKQATRKRAMAKYGGKRNFVYRNGRFADRPDKKMVTVKLNDLVDFYRPYIQSIKINKYVTRGTYLVNKEGTSQIYTPWTRGIVKRFTIQGF